MQIAGRTTFSSAKYTIWAKFRVCCQLKDRVEYMLLEGVQGAEHKIHAKADALGNPTGFMLTPGQVHDLVGAVYCFLECERRP